MGRAATAFGSRVRREAEASYSSDSSIESLNSADEMTQSTEESIDVTPAPVAPVVESVPAPKKEVISKFLYHLDEIKLIARFSSRRQAFQGPSPEHCCSRHGNGPNRKRL